MISITVVNSAATGSKLAVIRRKLDYETNKAFFRTIQLSDFQERALEYLRSITPVGKHTSYYDSLGVKAPTRAQMTLKDSWRVKRVTTEAYIGFEVTSLLERAGKRGRAKLFSIEYGRSAGSYVAERSFSFFSTQRNSWTFIEKGKTVEIDQREGKHLVKKTSDYISSVLLPEIRDRVSSLVRSRFEG